MMYRTTVSRFSVEQLLETKNEHTELYLRERCSLIMDQPCVKGRVWTHTYDYCDDTSNGTVSVLFSSIMATVY